MAVRTAILRPMSLLWRNGDFIDSRDFSVSPADRGLMHGLGLFETILAVNGRPVFVDEHLKRLGEGCARLRWEPVLPDLPEIMMELIRANGLDHGRARIRLAITGGGGNFRDLTLGGDHLIWMAAAPVDPPPATTTANLSPWPRNEHSPLAGLKCASYAENLIALDHARQEGFEETLFTNTKGLLCEAATSNVFLVRDGTLATPTLASGCLPGITRAQVIRHAAEFGIRCEERDIRPDELGTADEIFLTSATRGVVSVVRFEGHSLPSGPVTQRLGEAQENAARRFDSKDPRGG